MRKLRVYLDTSVINFLYADDAPEKRDITREFFARRLHVYEVSISDVVLFEIASTKDEGKLRLLVEAVKTYNLSAVPMDQGETEEVNGIVAEYLRARVFPERKREDALHVAISTVFEFDVLLSWNFHHLANITKEIRINALNERLGYLKRLNIRTPLEVMGDETEGR